MEFYGITGIAQKIMGFYLRGRYQRVVLYNNENKCCSEWKEIHYGVPQGSVLGPIFFLLYINDLLKLICDLSKPIVFADDTSIIILDKDSANFKIKTNKLFDIASEWFATYLLKINYKKKLIFYSFKQKIVKCWIFRSVIRTSKFQAILMYHFWD
jgi:hypothetical protein